MQSLLKRANQQLSISIPLQLGIAAMLASILILSLINSAAFYIHAHVSVGVINGILQGFFDSFRYLEFWVASIFPGICVYLLAKVQLEKLNRMVLVSHKISEGQLDVRFEEDSNVSEFRALSQMANQMLDQLEIAFSQQKLAYQQQGQFIANAAHEFRTPLATMRANLEAIQSRQALPDLDLFEWVSRHEKSMDRLEKLVEDLLLLARQDNIQKEEVVLGVLLEEVIAELEPLAQQETIDIILEGDAGILAMGEEQLLMQVFSNLLENAIRYNQPSGSVTINLSQSGNKAEIKFSDTGIGISKAEQKLIFDRFYQVDKSRSHKGTGSGLGLSIVSHILKHHNGTILVESEMGKGTQFTVSLPQS